MLQRNLPFQGPNMLHSETGEPPPCLLVQVMKPRIFVTVGQRAATLRGDIEFSNCGQAGAYSARLFVVLRLLRLALREPDSPQQLMFTLCVDDFCHGLSEAKGPLPVFTMASCQTAPTIPVVQWSAVAGRDPDPAVWASTVRRRREFRRLLPPWSCRLAKAVWRGDLHNHDVYNNRWSSERLLQRQALSSGLWKGQGRLALVYQKCVHPEMLDLRVKLLHLGGKHVPQINESDFAPCVRAAEVDEPKRLGVASQAAAFQMAVHVEGNGGWADRLRHLLLSGMVVL